MSAAAGRDGRLLRGRGASLGPCATRFPEAERTLLHLLRAQAHDRGDRTWLVFDGRDSLTFGAAYTCVNRVANAVVAHTGRGSHVALFLPNQVEWFPAFLGAMAAGGVAVPLNAELRGPLLEFVIAKSESRILVTRADMVDRLAALGGLGAVELVVVCGAGDVPAAVHGVPTVGWEAWIAAQDDDPPPALPDPADVAQIQFTSGTTGESKGVVCPHQFVFLYSALECDTLQHPDGAVLTTPMPLYHAAALHLIGASALQLGCVAHLKSRFSARAFWPDAAADGATFAIIFGPMAAILLKTVAEAPEHRLERMFCVPFPPGGEEFERRFRVRLLWQGYGMTEIMPHPMPAELTPGVPYDTIGHPVDWMEYGAVDDRDRCLPPGELGQLAYRPLIPDAMARGYFRAPEATEKAFRNEMFHTGDLGFVDEEGRVHYRGRQQDRIRRRGENVSAAELEFVALQHDDVLEAAGYGVPGELGEHEIKLDVIVRDDGCALAELHAWLVERLPRYMVPLYLERRTSFPKTPSERVEKYRLAEEPLDRPEVAVFQPAPR